MAVESLPDRIDRLWRATGRYQSERQFLRTCGISEAYLSQFRSRCRAIGDQAGLNVESAHRMARELGLSIEDLIGADPLHLPDDEYPSRAQAVAAARLLRYPESAVVSVSAQHPAVDPGARYWFRLIDAAASADVLPVQPASGKRGGPLRRGQRPR
jgi:hypothetical protein